MTEDFCRGLLPRRQFKPSCHDLFHRDANNNTSCKCSCLISTWTASTWADTSLTETSQGPEVKTVPTLIMFQTIKVIHQLASRRHAKTWTAPLCLQWPLLGQLYRLKLNTECQFMLWMNRSREQCSPLLTSAQARFKRCSYTFSHSVPVPLERLQTHQGNIYRVGDRTIFNTRETLKDTRQTRASCLGVQVLWKKEHFQLGSVVHRQDSCCYLLVRSHSAWERHANVSHVLFTFSCWLNSSDCEESSVSKQNLPAGLCHGQTKRSGMNAVMKY